MRNGYDVSTPAFTAINANNFNSEDYQEKQNRKGKVMQLLEISTWASFKLKALTTLTGGKH